MFTHLHVHSHYSLLDGLPKIHDLVKRTKELGMASVALTDHGTMYGAIEFYQKVTEAGIKPIIGLEAYVAPNSLYEKNSKIDDYTHIILLAANLEGYHNLIKLVTISHLEGYYYKPRIDKNLLQKYSSGLICLSGCLNSEMAKLVLADKIDEAEKLARAYRDMFGDGNFYLEIQNHLDSLEQSRVNNELIKLSKQSSIPLALTQDIHYLYQEDREAQDVMVCVNTGRLLSDKNRLNMSAFNLSMTSEAEVRESFSYAPEAVDNTNLIADKCNVALELNKKWYFMNYDVPSGKNVKDYLKEVAYQAVETRGLNMADVCERIDYELDIINQKGYATYFLVVADYVNFARVNGIISTTRGSAAGSLVGYLLGITNINPLVYHLPFERFLNPSRPTPPDIDVDFADVERGRVIEYITNKYGKDKVAHIVTFGSLQAKAAVRDTVRVMGLPYSLGDKLSKMIPHGKHGFHMTLDEAIRITPDLGNWYQRDDQVHQVLDLAKKIEGCVRHASTHAAGMIISPTPLTDYIPLQKETGGESIITQYDMHCIEAVGLIKVDILGIRNLSILGYARDLIKKTCDVSLDLENLSLDDKTTYDYLSSGHTLGLFQLGSAGMTRYLKELQPSNIFDIMAMISLFRPGPMDSIPDFIKRKHNRKLIKYIDPRLHTILKMSYGIITYQDDVLLIAIQLAGFTWEEADKLRKAMGKKIPQEMAAQKEKFITGCLKGQLAQAKADKLWHLIEPFAAYGFNKAHAASYAMIAYQTAYLKAHWTAEFMTAVLTAESDNADKVAEAILECKSLDINVLPPDINESFENFTYINKGEIRFGILAIKNLGSDIVEKIIKERVAGGRFKTLVDFMQRMCDKGLSKRSLEGLIKSGAMDEFGARTVLIASMDKMLDYCRHYLKTKTSNQDSLFGWLNNSNASSDRGYDDPLNSFTLESASQVTQEEQLAWEKEYLGLYISGHPFDKFINLVKDVAVSLSSLSERGEGDSVVVAGTLGDIKKIITRSNEQMVFAELTDMLSEAEVVVFPSLFSVSANLWSKNNCVIMLAKISTKDDQIKLLCEQAQELTVDNLNDVVAYFKQATNKS